jgi:hypothetical protein
VAVLSPGEDQALTAAAAEQRTLEVVVMEAALVATDRVRADDGLDFFK